MLACPLPARPSLFLADCGELALRVRGSGHDGRLIRLRSAKCTVGSAPGCTLRLLAPGVAPLHCWILRGREGTVVRRLHGPATLNGGQLDEASLSAGDRLRLGAVELEVVECSRRNSPAAAEAFAVPVADTAELERELSAALERINRLETESRQGWQSSITAAERADQLRTALANAHQQLDDACRELTASQATMQRQTDELHALRSELSAARQGNEERTDLESRMQLETAALRDQQTRSLAELTELRAAYGAAIEERSRLTSAADERERQLAAQRDAWNDERAQLTHKLEAREAELCAVREQSATQTGVMTIAMTQGMPQADPAADNWRNQCEELQRQLGECQQQLQTASERIQQAEAAEARYRELQGELAAMQPELTSAREQIAALAASAAAQQDAARQAAELQRDREQLAGEREQFVREQEAAADGLRQREAQVEQRAAELQRSLETAESRLAELDALRVQLAAERDTLGERAERLAQRELEVQSLAAAAPQAAALPAAEAAGAELAQQLAESESLGRQLAEQIEFLELRCRELEQQRQAALSQAAAAYQQAAAEIESAPAGEAASAEASADESVNITAPFQSLDDVVEEAAADENQSIAGENVRDSNEVETVLGRLVRAGIWRSEEEGPPNAAPHPAASESVSGAGDPAPAAEDESIDNYMDRLLKRVRGDSPVAAGAWKQNAASQTPASTSELAQEELAAAPSDLDAEYLPRTTAPEQTHGLSAMRDLANSAARNAIETHIRKHTGKQAVGRLFTATLILASSTLLGYWAWRSHSLTAGVGAGVGAASGLFWSLVAMRRIAKVFRRNRVAAPDVMPAESPPPPDGN